MRPHPRLESLSEAVVVRFSEERGRYLVAGRTIKRGEVVAVEKPAVVFPITADTEKYCSNCCRTLLTTPLQCDRWDRTSK